MNNEIQNHAELAGHLSKFDRKLNPKEGLDEDAVFEKINQPAHHNLDLTQLNYQMDQFFSTKKNSS